MDKVLGMENGQRVIIFYSDDRFLSERYGIWLQESFGDLAE